MAASIARNRLPMH